MKALLLVLAACGAQPTPRAPAARHKELASIGESFTIDSRVLGERRRINVYVPDGKGPFPVLYMPDGGIHEDFPHVVGSVDVSITNGIIRPVIVVGIENTERRRDLAPATVVADEQKAAPHAGGTARFRQFIREELFPLIERRYRVTKERALIGESLAGLFAIETLLLEPDMFDGYIAADPSLWWNEQTLVTSASGILGRWRAGAKRLYLATADSPESATNAATLSTALRIQAPPIDFVYEPMPNESHGTIYPTAALHGIRTLFGQTAPP